MAKELQIVGFRIGRETFGLPISLVHEIVRPPEITNVPHAPEYVEGVMKLDPEAVEGEDRSFVRPGGALRGLHQRRLGGDQPPGARERRTRTSSR